MQDTTGATVEQLLPTTPDDLVTQLNDAAKCVAMWPYATAVAVVAAIALGSPFGIVLLVLALPGLVWLYLRDRARRSVVAFYEVDGPQARWFEQAVDVLGGLGRCAAVWRINAAGEVTTTHQYKVNAGASRILSRDRVSVTSKGPKVLVTNITVPGIEAGRHALHFLPNRLLVRDGRRFAAVRYEDLHVAEERTRFIEDGSVPRDAVQVDTTWRCVNVKGGPDRRFNNNAQLPIMLYARIAMTTSAGLLWIVDASVVAAGERVARVLADARSPTVIDAPTPAQLTPTIR
jgi:DNA polymerase-3 subunit epsilon